MVCVKYFCDCCNNEVSKKDKGLILLEMYSPDLENKGSEYPYKDVEVCFECYKKINQLGTKKIFEKIKNESNAKPSQQSSKEVISDYEKE